MKVENWNLTAVANGAELDCDKSPFMEGSSAALMVMASSTRNAATVFNFQQSNDGGRTWSNYLSASDLNAVPAGGAFCKEIVLGNKVRPVITAYGAGEVNFALMGAD